jgi:GT2 family glycosyltransferase
MVSETPQISVVIPTYNRRDSVLQLLSGVYLQEGVSFEVIVVDDCSPDDTVASISATFPSVRLFRNPTNGGPAVSRNRGVREAKGEFIVGLDSDVTINDSTLFARIAETFQRFPQATALALRVLEGDGKADDAPRWCHPFPINPYADHWVWTDYISGTGYACRRESMIQSGLFPEILYMHHEEVEISYRLLDNGGWILHCPDLKVLHHPHPSGNRSRILAYYHPRNQVLLAAGIYPWPRSIAFLVPRATFQFFLALKNWDLGSYYEALRDALKLLPRRLRERQPLGTATLRQIRLLRRRPRVTSRPDSARGTDLSS